jgi:hypothetical protein
LCVFRFAKNVSFTGLADKDEFERAKINELIDFEKDVAAALGPYIFVKRRFREGDVVSITMPHPQW